MVVVMRPSEPDPSFPLSEGESARPMTKDELWAAVKARRKGGAPAADNEIFTESAPVTETAWERAAREEAERRAARAKAKALKQSRSDDPVEFPPAATPSAESSVVNKQNETAMHSLTLEELPVADVDETVDLSSPVYSGAAPETETAVMLSLDSSSVEKPADNSIALSQAKRTALISSFATCFSLLLLLGVIRIALPEPISAEIVAFAEAEDPASEAQAMKKIAQALPQAAPMAASLMPITASGVSELALPQITTNVTGSDLNIGSTLGSFGSGLTTGTAGGAVSFLGNRSVGKRIVFVVDVSSSMNASGSIGGQRISRFDLMKKELIRSVNGLPAGAQYQVVFFSDFGWAHDAVTPGDEEARLKLQWDIASDTVAEAKIPRTRYRTVSLGNIKSSRDIISKADNPGGTNWGSGLFIALKMTPPPDVVFFMTDGNASDEAGWVAAVTEANTRQGGKTIINTSAMMEPDAAVALSDLAINNGGSFTVVLSNGKVVKGENWFKGERQ